MRKIKTPNAQSTNALDSFQPGKPKRIFLVADTPFSFPPEEHFAEGGRFLVRIPAGATVRIHDLDDADGSDSFQLDPGVWDLSFDKHSEKLLTATANVTVQLFAQKEVV